MKTLTICGKEVTTTIINQINTTVKNNKTLTRTGLAKMVCEWMDLHNSKGFAQIDSCSATLNRWEKAGHIQLPQVQNRKTQVYKPRLPEQDVAQPLNVPSQVDLVKGLALVPVTHENRELTEIWNWLIIHEHPLDFNRLAGRQMRYLIGSDHGWLGAASFSAAALHLEAREDWIGWSRQARHENLNRVANMSRFLIRPKIHCLNLASKVLSLCEQRLQIDWMERYGESLVLLETFVESTRYKGSCYKAANWQKIGQTKGRGRQDRTMEYSLPCKDIYMHPLDPDFRTLLQKYTVQPAQSRPICDEDWLFAEFNCNNLGDKRLNKRVEKIARARWSNPSGRFSQVFPDWHDLKATYRFFSPQEKTYTMHDIMAPHKQNTLERTVNESLILHVQDSTSLNYNHLKESARGLGGIGRNQASGSVGLMLHSTLAFNPQGIPMGVLHAQCWARGDTENKSTLHRNSLPITDKESNKWMTSFAASVDSTRHTPNTRIVNIADREGDIYELFSEALKSESVDVLVRAQHDRCVEDPQKHLWAQMKSMPEMGEKKIVVPRKKGQKERTANLEVRCASVQIKAPRTCRKKHLPSLPVSAVWVVEVDPPEDVEAIQWMLLTTCSVNSLDDALEILRWYCIRWGIEEWHRIIKSGCKAERRQLESAAALQRALAFDLIIAWRIMLMVKLGRSVPDELCTLVFNDYEWKVLQAVLNKKKSNPAQASGNDS